MATSSMESNLPPLTQMMAGCSDARADLVARWLAAGGRSGGVLPWVQRHIVALPLPRRKPAGPGGVALPCVKRSGVANVAGPVMKPRRMRRSRRRQARQWAAMSAGRRWRRSAFKRGMDMEMDRERTFQGYDDPEDMRTRMEGRAFRPAWARRAAWRSATTCNNGASMT